MMSVASESVLVSLQRKYKSLVQYNFLRRIIAGGFWLVCGTILSRACVLAGGVVVARSLDSIAYGTYSLIQSTVAMLTVFASFGLATTATVYVAKYVKSDPGRAGRVVGLTTLLSQILSCGLALLFFLYPGTFTPAIFLGQGPGLILFLGAVLVYLSGVNNVQMGILAGFQKFRSIAISNAVLGAVSLSGIALSVSRYGLHGALAGLLAGLIASCLINYMAIKMAAIEFSVPRTFLDLFHERALLWRFSLPAGASGAFVLPIIWTCLTTLSLQPNGMQEVAIFNAAFQWYNAVLFIPSAVSSVTVSLLASAVHQRDKRNTLRVALCANAFASLSVAVIISLLASSISSLYGMEFQGTEPTLRILAIAAAVNSISAVAGQAFAASGRAWTALIFNLLWATVLLVVFYLAPNTSATALGLAIGFLISYGFHTFFQLAYLMGSERNKN
jgi:O-antigen/teichoic acid export membrane protein